MKIENTLLNSVNKLNSPLMDYKNNAQKEISTPSGEAFDDIYKAAVNLYQETSDYQKNANQLQMDFVTGKTDDILAVTMAQEKALTTLNFTVQITNKVVDAYKQIMQIQV